MVGGWPVELRAGLIGAAVGTLAWFAPDLVGGGDPITQRTLAGVAETLALLPVVFLVRLALDAVSYAARAPGGLFAPMLVLGAQLGLLFGLLCRIAFPDLNIQPEGFAVVGMAAFFIGVGQVGPASCGILASDWIVAGKVLWHPRLRYGGQKMFRYFAPTLTRLGVLTAHPAAFFVLACYVGAWLAFNPKSFDWQSVATVATWLMTLFIQRAEHRDTQAIHAKLTSYCELRDEPAMN